MGMRHPEVVAFWLEDMDSSGIVPYLESRLHPEMIVYGDWRPGFSRGVDVFDKVLKFAEDNFLRARVYKDTTSGWYVALLAGRVL